MNSLQKTLHKVDVYQQRHPALAFIYAVIKKYGEDEAGSQTALLTYYGFLSLFPLLLVLTTITNSIIGNSPRLNTTIIHGLTSYFPLLGAQLSGHVHSLHRSGLALVSGILFTLYGTRGVANSFRRGVQHIWQVPKAERESFPRSLLKSLTLVVVGGLGFLTASVIAGLAGAAGHGLAFRSLSVVVNLFILFWLFTFLLNFTLPRHVAIKEVRVGAATAAIGLVMLQGVGGYLLARELKSLDALYSYFALALGLLFWIYLQAQVIYFAVEIAAVNSRKLWPRSLSGSLPTAIDNKIDASQHSSI
jgi:YihY family inner membrane protein